MNQLLYLAEAFFIAYLMKLASSRLRMPSVSGYVVGGVILGGSLFFWIPGGRAFSEQWLFAGPVLEKFVIVTQIALGIISLSIGVELEWSRLKKLGFSIMSITACEALGAFLLVTGTTFLIWRDLSFSLILGAVSSATAPAATVAVIQQYRAKGPLTSTILAVIGIDDAFSLMIFAFALTIARGSLSGHHISIAEAILHPAREVGLSILIGGVLGLLSARFITTHSDGEHTLFLLGAVMMLTSGLSEHIPISPLLTNMAFGATLVNINPLVKSKIRSGFGAFMPIFYALFFIIGGAHLDISGFSSIWLMAVVYFICRGVGKATGASVGALMGKAMPKVRKYIGFSLLPQVGVAIALALVIQEEFGSGDYGEKGMLLAHNIMNILLVTTILTEFIGPYLTKLSLEKAGEVRE